MTQVAQRYGERQFVGAWVDHEQRERLAELAREEDRSVSSVIRRALDRELERADLRVVHYADSEGGTE